MHAGKPCMFNEEDGERFTCQMFNNEAQQTTAQASCNVTVTLYRRHWKDLVDLNLGGGGGMRKDQD